MKSQVSWNTSMGDSKQNSSSRFYSNDSGVGDTTNQEGPTFDFEVVLTFVSKTEYLNDGKDQI
jgi:hypothetical protein